MKPILALATALLIPCFSTLPAVGQEAGAEAAPAVVELWQEDPAQVFSVTDENLSDFLWIARPLIVFADSPNDPQFRLQMDLLNDRLDVLGLRDVIVLTDTDPGTPSALRTDLRPRGFMLVAVDKDGRVLFRKPAPWDVREISRSIDKSPIRLQEVEDARHSQ